MAKPCTALLRSWVQLPPSPFLSIWLTRYFNPAAPKLSLRELMDVDFPRALQDAREEMEQAGRLDIARNLREIRCGVNNSPSKLLAMMIIKERRKRTELLRIRKKILLSIVFALGSENGKERWE